MAQWRASRAIRISSSIDRIDDLVWNGRNAHAHYDGKGVKTLRSLLLDEPTSKICF